MPPESTPTPEQPPVKQSFVKRAAGPAMFAGFFIVWPATNVACAYLNYKTIDRQLDVVEAFKAAAQQVQ
jgi:hypothetical protein